MEDPETLYNSQPNEEQVSLSVSEGDISDPDDDYSDNENASAPKTQNKDQQTDKLSSLNWEALREVEDDLDNMDDQNLDNEAQDRILAELQTLTRGLFQDEISPSDTPSSRRSKESKMSKSTKDLGTFYERNIGFLHLKNQRLTQQRKQREEEESKSVTLKPNLVAKQQSNHVPLLERVKTTQAKRKQEVENYKKEKEEKAEKEFKSLPFKPNINEISKALTTQHERGNVADRLYSEAFSKQDTLASQDDTNNLFKPKIDKISKELAKKVITQTSTKVEDRLLLQAEKLHVKKEKLVSEAACSFAPRLNKNTHKIIDHLRQERAQLGETRLEKSDIKGTSNEYPKNQSLSSISVHQVETYQKDEKSGNRFEKKNKGIDVNGINLDDQLMDNLKQLTLLLQTTNKVSPNNGQVKGAKNALNK